MENILLCSDSYKFSHWLQYPDGADGYFGYIEARGTDRNWTKVVAFGLQIFLKKYLSKPFTRENIDEAETFMKAHGEPFNRKGWEYILKTYNGYFPITIKAAPEGTPLPLSVPLLTITCEDKECFWCASWLESILLQNFWYPTTVLTQSYHIRKMIKEEMEKSCDTLDGLPFKLNDFGLRGVSSLESACIGGAAHLASGFMGSDNVPGILTANKYYNCDMAGFSIPAAEHSTITSWGEDGEVDAYRNMLKQYAKPGAFVAVVSDSYDIFNACDRIWGTELTQEVIDSGATIIIRPDSGNPETVTLKCIEILGDKFGYTVNSKGYKVLNNVRLIQGDGVNERSIKNILSNFRIHNWSADNIAFGMGGALLQGVNRDTLSFALKCSAIRINGVWVDVQKDPITDYCKRSKAGRISTYTRLGEDSILEYVCAEINTISETPNWEDKKMWMPEVLKIAYELIQVPAKTIFGTESDLQVYKPKITEITFDEVRANSNL